MNLQKHERAALEAASGVADTFGCTVEFAVGSKHRKLVLHGPRGQRCYSVSGSPKDRDHEAAYARQWARRAAREVA